MADERVPKQILQHKSKEPSNSLEKMELICEVGTGLLAYKVVVIEEEEAAAEKCFFYNF
jgi:hypothetical protein